MRYRTGPDRRKQDRCLNRLVLALLIFQLSGPLAAQEPQPREPQPRELFGEQAPVPPADARPVERLSAEPAPSTSILIERLEAPGHGERAIGGAVDWPALPNWSDLSPVWLEWLLARIADPIADPDLRKLVIATLAGPGPSGSSEEVLRARARALLAIGQAEPAAELAAAELTKGDSELLRIWLDATLLAADLDQACAGFGAIDALPADVRLLCLWRSDDSARLELNRALAEEQGVVLPTFLRDVLALAGSDRALKAPAYVAEPTVLAMLASVPVRIEDEIVNPAVHAALAVNPGLDDSVRLDMSERAASFGLVDPAELKRRYLEAAAKIDNAPDSVQLASGEPAASTILRARSIREIQDETVPIAKIALIANFWQNSVDARVRTPLAMMLAPEARRFRPAGDFAGQARPLAELLLSAGDIAVAKEWLERAFDADPATVRPLAMLTGLEPASSWLEIAPASRPRLALLLDGLGYSLPETIRTDVTELDGGGIATPFALWRLAGLAEQAGDTRLALLALVAMIQGDPNHASDLALWRCLRGLTAIGLGDIAIAIAARHWLDMANVAGPAE